jgi:hypothetical protein
MEAYMSQITLRQIPAHLERQLRLQARKNGRSLNKTAVSLISKGLGLEEPVKVVRKRDLSRFSGTMSIAEVKEFEANTRDFSNIDREIWNT